jgi:hypothetical protein
MLYSIYRCRLETGCPLRSPESGTPRRHVMLKVAPVARYGLEMSRGVAWGSDGEVEVLWQGSAAMPVVPEVTRGLGDG